MSLKHTARECLGELMIVGFQGPSLSGTTAEWLHKEKIGGVILFTQNFESTEQVTKLVTSVQKQTEDLPLWVSVDHEGGKVQRFRKGLTRIPEMQKVGALDSPKAAYDLALGMACELRALGININYSPVADILTNPSNPVIGNRAFGSEPEHVSRMVTAMVRGHLAAGVQPCVKHFPGHGDTSVDSHFALPKVDTPLEVLRKREWIPFQKAFKAGCPFLMTAHVLHADLDPDRPATMSSRVLKEILRGELRFNGVIMSDDLEMKAIADHYGEDEAPRLALEAGCDLLIYRSEEAGSIGFEALVHALEEGTLKPETVIAAAERSKTLKRSALLKQPEVTAAPAPGGGSFSTWVEEVFR